MLWLLPWLCLFLLITLFYLLILKISTSMASVRTKEVKILRSETALDAAVLCVTWNTANSLPSSSELEVLLPQADLAQHDIVAVALQECPAQGWLHALNMHCGSSFILVGAESSRDCIRLAVLIKSSSLSDVGNIQTGSETFGLPVFFRKGGAAVCFTLRSRRMLFISAHLSAHEGQVTTRNTDAEALFCRLAIGCSPSDMRQPLLSRFDSAFLLGDLNYRLSASLKATLDLLSAPTTSLPASIAQLAEQDELTVELRRSAGTYKGWKEAPLLFPPTYKYNTKDPMPTAAPLVSLYDQRRTPAWCDRVLFLGARCTNYEARDRGRSDHRAVCGSFLV